VAADFGALQRPKLTKVFVARQPDRRLPGQEQLSAKTPASESPAAAGPGNAMTAYFAG
jgi:hypothetical protein